MGLIHTRLYLISVPTVEYTNKGLVMDEMLAAKQRVIDQMNKMLGYVPVGTSDLLAILTHPDMLGLTHEFVGYAATYQNVELD